MLNLGRKKKIVAVMLPAYLLVWTVVSGCSSYALALYFLCFGFPFKSETAVAPEALAIPAIQGDIVFVGNAGETIAARERRLVFSTTWGIPVVFPAGESTLSGQFSPFGAPARSLARPKRIDAEFVHADTDGKTLLKDRFKLKVKGDKIPARKKATDEHVIAAGERLDFYVKPIKNALDLSETLQMFFDMPMATSPLSKPGPGWLARAADFAAILNESAEKAKDITVVTTTFGIGVEIKPQTVIITGSQMNAPVPAVADSSLLAPKTIKLTAEHLDPDGKVKGTFKVTVKFAGGVITPAVNANFKGFSIEAGDAVRLKIKTGGGKFSVGDLFGLNFLVF